MVFLGSSRQTLEQNRARHLLSSCSPFRHNGRAVTYRVKIQSHYVSEVRTNYATRHSILCPFVDKVKHEYIHLPADYLFPC
jgi:hypothetical protein